MGCQISAQMVEMADVHAALLVAALGSKVTLHVLAIMELMEDLVAILDLHILHVMITIVGINNLCHILVD
jgi:hypothetical protein